MLGLKTATDAAWATQAARDLDRVLVDHAHCEMKAASNALSLAARYPGSPAVVRALTHLAREEIEHFQRVLTLLEERGLSLGPPPVDEYAAALRREAAAEKRGPQLGALVDRLLVGALIEARSCERFKLLAAALERAGERALSDFYTRAPRRRGAAPSRARGPRRPAWRRTREPPGRTCSPGSTRSPSAKGPS